MTGRPTKRTPTVEETIIEAVRKGLTYRLAAMSAGIAHDTLREWLKAGDEGDERFVAFSAAVRKAEADGAAANLEYINTAQDWRARAWILEHRHPEDFGTKSKVEVGGDPNHPLPPMIINVIPPGTPKDDSVE
jgi:hypothetical protein